MNSHRQHYMECNRLQPRERLPDMLEDLRDNHEAVYWTCIGVGILAGSLLTLGVLSYLGRLV